MDKLSKWQRVEYLNILNSLGGMTAEQLRMKVSNSPTHPLELKFVLQVLDQLVEKGDVEKKIGTRDGQTYYVITPKLKPWE